MEEKMESLQLEWTYNLTMQLEKQKDYFEGKIGQLQQSFASESTELRQKLLKTTEENHQLQVCPSKFVNLQQSRSSYKNYSYNKLSLFVLLVLVLGELY